jgi:Lon protease-like protein
MRINSINVDSWSNGRFMVTLEGGTALHIDMTEEESERFRQMAVEIFTSRQKAIAHEIENAGPALLADFSEVPERAPVLDDDTPF